MNAWAVVKNGKLVTFPINEAHPDHKAPAVYLSRKAARYYCLMGTDEQVVPCRITLPLNVTKRALR